MRENDIQVIQKRKKTPNLVNRQVVASAPDQLRLVDLIYVDTEQGWLYLAVILVVNSCKIVSWA